MFRKRRRFSRPTANRAALACAAAFALSILCPAPDALAAFGFGPSVQLSAGDSIDDRNPQLAADGQGRWVAIWSGQYVMVSRSADDGATWSPPAPLWVPPPAIAASQYTPTSLQTDKAGVWLAAWHHLRAPSAPVTEWMTDLRVSRSTDNGATWSDPTLIDSIRTCPSQSGFIGVIGGGGALQPYPMHADLDLGQHGVWGVAWTGAEFFGTAPPCPSSGTVVIGEFVPYIRQSRSFDRGANWAPSDPIFPPPPSADIPYAVRAWHQVAADGTGNRLAAALELRVDTAPQAFTWNVAISRSVDNGQSWSVLPVRIEGGGVPLGLSASGSGGWDLLAINLDSQLLATASTQDAGDTWTLPRLVSASTPRGVDGSGDMISDGQGNRLIAWNATEMHGQLASGCAPYIAKSIDELDDWGAPAPLPPSPSAAALSADCGFTEAIYNFSRPRIATNGAGRWGLIYPANPQPSSTFGSDNDIFISFSSDIAAPTGDAEIVSILASPEMGVGDSQAIGVVVRNTGQTSWSEAELHKLAVTNDPCGLLAAAAPRANLPPGATIPPGAEATFTFTLRAPSTPGACTLEFQMVQEFVEFFGERETIELEVVATADAKGWVDYE